MCNKTVVIVAKSMHKGIQKPYEHEVKSKVLNGEKDRKLIFVYGQDVLNSPHGYLIPDNVVKVVFDTNGTKDESKIIDSVKKAIKNNKKCFGPILLRIGHAGDSAFDCIGIDSLKDVRSFEPLENSANVATK
ncbi:MAG: hypothetical protein NTU81_00575 [Candidatus Nomurabacteria bacterium]|nr:hypothetical protein [Candidatus Nomurabacteria bacterium]